MSLTPERRKALRIEAERHRQEQLKKLGVKDTMNPAFVPSLDKEKEQKTETEVTVEQQTTTQPDTKQSETQSDAVSIPVDGNSEQAATSLSRSWKQKSPRKKLSTFLPVRSTGCWSHTTVTVR